MSATQPKHQHVQDRIAALRQQVTRGEAPLRPGMYYPRGHAAYIQGLRADLARLEALGGEALDAEEEALRSARQEASRFACYGF